MNIDKLTPAPWGFADGCWVDPEGNPVFETSSDQLIVGNVDDIEFVSLARNAFDIMMRRGWWAVCDSEKWWVRGEGTGPYLYHNDQPWADPFTALTEADKWYRENVERQA